MNKKSYKVIFYILIILVNICLVAFLIFRFVDFKKGNNNQAGTENETVPANDVYKGRKVTFKKFTFNIPDEITYGEVDKYKFSLVASDWDAEVEIFINLKGDFFDKAKEHYQTMMDGEMDVEEGYFIETDINRFLVYNLREGSKNRLLVYYKIVEPFFMEVNFHNVNNDFNTESLDEVMRILSSYEFDYDSKEEFVYHNVKFDN